jgi:hypothetical protein
MATAALNRASWSKLACHSALGQAQNRKQKGRRLPQLGPNHPVELTAHSAGFCGESWRFPLWAAAHRGRSPNQPRDHSCAIMHGLKQRQEAGAVHG